MSRSAFREIAKPTTMEKLMGWFSPGLAVKRRRARVTMAVSGGYTGASKTRRSLKSYTPGGQDADADLLPDLETLRERSRDMVRNMPLAAGVINTKVTNVVGTGIKLHARIDRAALNMSDAGADVWETNTEREWRLFWNSQEVDAARTQNGDALSAMVYRQAKENGDVFVLLPRITRKNSVYNLTLQVIEADRVCNENNAQDTDTLAAGIRKDTYGAPLEYQILSAHPGGLAYTGGTWQKIPAFGARLGLRNILHLYKPTRPGQTRGVPDLAAVIEPLKQLTRYTEAELMAAVVSGMFTVFVENELGDPTFDLDDTATETGATTSDDDYKLANGAIIGLAPGEKIHDTNPGRPNAAFDPFTLAILRQIGVAVEIPFEILVKHFTSSYSAARAALLEAWKYFMVERKWLTDNFHQVIYEIWMYEAVTAGRIAAPGFLADPAVRQAYLSAEWVGPTKGQIDELKEVNAAKKRADMGVTTLAEETAAMTGGDWEKKHPQSVKEYEARKKAGLIVEKEPPGFAPNNQGA